MQKGPSTGMETKEQGVLRGSGLLLGRQQNIVGKNQKDTSVVSDLPDRASRVRNSATRFMDKKRQILQLLLPQHLKHD